MTFLAAFDGSPLSRAALRRAAAFATDERVVAVAVVPGDFAYARDRGWVEGEDGREFDPEVVAERLRERAAAVAPDAEFRAEQVAEYAGTHTVARRLVQVADEIDASVLFLGSEDAGSIVTPVSSVGSRVASDARYDVFIARHPDDSEPDAA